VVTLAIDTATTVAVVGLVDERGVRAERVIGGDAYGAQHVLASVAQVLASAEGGLDEVDRITVGVGPGSFTGLRIGIATALGLGDGAGIPVCPASTLDALRFGAEAATVAIIDARRGEVFAGGHGIPVGVYTPDALATRLTASHVAVGDGAVRHRSVLQVASIPADDDVRHRPGVRALVAVGDEDAPVEPNYLRQPDAVVGGAPS
jgi:tRNA threonylcarbamoyladenosine biosynthesis protein TsaB